MMNHCLKIRPGIFIACVALCLAGCRQPDNDFDLLYRMSVKETKHTDEEIVIEADYRFNGKANMFVYEGEGASFGGERKSGTLVIRAWVIDTPQGTFPNTTGTQTIRMTYGWKGEESAYSKVYPPQVAPALEDSLRAIEQSGTYGFYDEVVIGKNTDDKGEKTIRVKVMEE